MAASPAPGRWRKGNPVDLGPTALIRVSSGVRVIVVTRKMQALDQSLFTHIGVEPSAQKILALKSSVHFRARFPADRGAGDRRRRARAGGGGPGGAALHQSAAGAAAAAGANR